MELIEKIGKITLDYSQYPGEDFYCDGAIEDEMLDIAKNYAFVEYPRIIEERANWPIMYHFSTHRENIVDWLPMDKNMKVLEIGSGCGAITGALARKAGEVTCVELSKKRSLINAYRHMDCDNVTIKVGNFKDIEPNLDMDYDYVLLIGVFEYGQSYMGGETPYEDFLKIIRKHAKRVSGKVVIAIENKYGLKYWAGCREDHLGSYFSGLEGYTKEDGVKTFSKKMLSKMFEACGENNYHFYYPYPDYKFMTTLFSDKRMPKKGELYNNDRNYDRDRVKLFDEKAVFDGLIEDDTFDYFSNSYLIVLGDDTEVDYVRYSNDRADEYKICTEQICVDGRKLIKKRALLDEGKAHINAMSESYNKLKDRYNTSELSVCPCKVYDNGRGILFPYVNGVSLETLLDEKVASKDEEGFVDLFTEYVKRVNRGYMQDIADLDLVFSNIIVNGDDWTIIDYEWVEHKRVSTKQIAFRALYCYILEDDNRNKFNYDLIIKSLGITVDEEQGYRDDEMAFQKKVTSKNKSMGELREIIGGKIFSMESSVADATALANRLRIRVYEDYGQGFSEDNAYYIEDVYDTEGYIESGIDIPSTVKRVRIDPCEDYAITYIDEMMFNDRLIDIKDNKRVYINGKKLKESNLQGITAVFFNNDPNIVIEIADVVRSTGNTLRFKFKTSLEKKEIIDTMASNLKRMIRL